MLALARCFKDMDADKGSTSKVDALLLKTQNALRSGAKQVTPEDYDGLSLPELQETLKRIEQFEASGVMTFDSLGSAIASATGHDSASTSLVQSLEAASYKAEHVVREVVDKGPALPGKKRGRSDTAEKGPKAAKAGAPGSSTQLRLSQMPSISHETARSAEQAREDSVLEFLDSAPTGGELFAALKHLPCCEDTSRH